METFNKIGAASTTHLGLETLYNLLEEHPTFPVEDLLARTSEPFLNYIDKGLHKVSSRTAPCDPLTRSTWLGRWRPLPREKNALLACL